MRKNEILFSKLMTAVAVFGSLFLIPDFSDAATRGSTRSIASARKNVSTTTQTETQTQTQTTKTETTTKKTSVKTQTSQPELIISNKSGQFEDMISDIMESASPDNSFAEQIRKQRAALAASEASLLANDAQSKALSTNSSSCDVALRKCMMETCGKDFTKCATDGDTMFGEKLNRCRTNTECSAQEFNLFSTEIKADRDVNVRLSSYDAVINCGNEYNACIVNECGTTYTKCLGRTAENAAVQKCSIIAKECMEPDSGLAARFSTAIGKLRENAEKDVKTDENRLYTLRDLMSKRCKSLGATFDERSFDCVYSIEFYAGSNQSTPLASRKAYAGDSFICMQEWFGINTTTAQENAYRETRSQTAASSAMLGSGLGTAAGLISSGAIDRALDTQKAKKDYKKECTKQGGKWKNGECTGIKFEDDSETVDEDVEAPVPDTVYETTGTGTSSEETDVEGDTTSGTTGAVNITPRPADDLGQLSTDPTITGQELTGVTSSGAPLQWNPVDVSNGTNSGTSSAVNISQKNGEKNGYASKDPTITGQELTGVTSSGAPLQWNPVDVSNGTNSGTSGAVNISQKNGEKTGYASKDPTTTGQELTGVTSSGASLQWNPVDTQSTTQANSNKKGSSDNNGATTASTKNATSNSQSANCGVLGKKECNSNYKICEMNGQTKACTGDMLPSHATAGRCYLKRSAGYKVCTATACEDGYEVARNANGNSQGYCTPKKGATNSSQSANKTSSNASTRSSGSTTNNKQTTNTKQSSNTTKSSSSKNSSNKDYTPLMKAYNADGTCDINRPSSTGEWNNKESNVDGWCSEMKPGEWKYRDSRGDILHGKSTCATNNTTMYSAGTPSGSNGRYCWCKFISVDGKSYSSFKWGYAGSFDFAKNCEANCAYSCVYYNYHKSSFNSVLWGIK